MKKYENKELIWAKNQFLLIVRWGKVPRELKSADPIKGVARSKTARSKTIEVIDNN